MRCSKRVAASVLVATATVGFGAVVNTGTASAYDFRSTTVTCGSENPFPWMPGFTYVLDVFTGHGSEGGGPNHPILFVNGTSDNRAIEVSPFQPPFSVDYAVSTTVDWHNTTTGQSGSSTFDQNNPLPRAGLSTNPGAGHVEFTSRQTTGAAFTFVNPKVSVCAGAIDVAPV